MSRHLYRIVYVFLYLVLAVRLCIAIVHSLWYGGAMDFDLFNQRLPRGPDSGDFDAKDDVQLLVVSCLLALAFARVLAARMRRRSVDDGERT